MKMTAHVKPSNISYKNIEFKNQQMCNEDHSFWHPVNN